MQIQVLIPLVQRMYCIKIGRIDYWAACFDHCNGCGVVSLFMERMMDLLSTRFYKILFPAFPLYPTFAPS